MLRTGHTGPVLLMAIILLILPGCTESTGDVFTSADGHVLEGQLVSIGSGLAVFSTGSAAVPNRGRIWCLNGTTSAGEVTASQGVVTAGSFSVPVDSIFVVVWEDTEIYQDVFQVDASYGWTATSVELEPGEMLSIQGTGTVVTETGISTPEGQEKYSSSVSLVSAATSGQLVFKVGEQGLPVAAGSSWVGESPGFGTLMLAVNVPLQGSIHSRGVYSVEVAAGTNGSVPGAVTFYPAAR